MTVPLEIWTCECLCCLSESGKRSPVPDAVFRDDVERTLGLKFAKLGHWSKLPFNPECPKVVPSRYPSTRLELNLD
jgi:hypothetical protein